MAKIKIEDLSEKMRVSREEMVRIQGGFRYSGFISPFELYKTTYGGDGRAYGIEHPAQITRNIRVTGF